MILGESEALEEGVLEEVGGSDMTSVGLKSENAELPGCEERCGALYTQPA